MENCITLDPHSLKAAAELLFSALTAIGTIAVAILAIWGDWVRARLVPGALRIEIHDRGDLSHLTDQHGQPLPPPNAVYFYHFKVVNRKRWITPKNCRVLLKAMSRRDQNGIFQPSALSVPCQFVWAPAEITPSVIAIEHEQILDFGIVQQRTMRFEPRLYSYPNN